jgi:transcriptional regulator with XRE-family HTH domain
MQWSSQRVAFGLRLRALRTDRGWSQEEFAHRAELDRTYVSGVERGVRNPTLDVITRLAQTLDVEVAELFPPSPSA